MGAMAVSWGRWALGPLANDSLSELWAELQGLGAGVPCPGWQESCTDRELETLDPFSQ